MDLKSYVANLKLVTDQVSRTEVGIVLRELDNVLKQHVIGDVVEFGCYEGTTSIHLAKWLEKTDRSLYLYDSFEGLPDKTAEDDSPAGLQFKAGELFASKKTLVRNFKQADVPIPRIKKAWFSDLNEDDVPHVIAFAFLDGDYYDSVRDPLRLIDAYLTPGATIVIDDYANEALPGAAKAVDEWIRAKGYTMSVEASLAIIRTPVDVA